MLHGLHAIRTGCSSETWPISWHVSLYFEFFLLITKYFKDNWKIQKSTKKKIKIIYNFLSIDNNNYNLPGYFSLVMCVYVFD